MGRFDSRVAGREDLGMGNESEEQTHFLPWWNMVILLVGIMVLGSKHVALSIGW